MLWQWYWKLLAYTYLLTAGHSKEVPKLQGNCPSYSWVEFRLISLHNTVSCSPTSICPYITSWSRLTCYAPSDPCGSCCVLDSDQLMVQALPTMVYVLYVSELLTSGIPMCTFPWTSVQHCGTHCMSCLHCCVFVSSRGVGQGHTH